MRRQLRGYRNHWWREQRIWEVPEIDDTLVMKLQERLRLSPLLAKVLCGRGITTPDAARAFLFASGKDLPDPTALPGIAHAAELIVKVLKAGVPILVHGDYDADGISATALLSSTLARLGGRVLYFTPNRRKHGYGVSEGAIRSAKHKGIGLLVTVDCGITAFKELSQAKEAGIATVIVDHHEPPARLPPADGIVNPKLPGCDYPFRDLCAAALALKLAQAVLERLGKSARLEDLPVELAALATVTDVMPLVGENRALVREGLNALRQARHLGLRALMEVAGLDAKNIRSSHLGFILGPRLNAAGRMDDPKPALKLLLTNDPNEARQLAQKLDTHNRQRQREEEATLQMAVQMVDSELDLTKERVIVLASPEWHPGVIGIVASRLVELYHRPVFLVALQDGLGHGSARSIDKFSVVDALRDCQSLLLSGGGHKAAGGFKITCEHLPTFRERLNQLAGVWLTDEDLRRRERVDAMVTADEVRLNTVSELPQLEPTGFGNPKPVLMVQNAKAVCVVRNGNRLLLRVQQGERVLELTGEEMGGAHSDLPVGEPVHVCFTADIRYFGSIPTMDLQLVDFCPAHSDAVIFRRFGFR